MTIPSPTPAATSPTAAPDPKNPCNHVFEFQKTETPTPQSGAGMIGTALYIIAQNAAMTL